MAQPIPRQTPVRDPREDAIARLREAPSEHAEAILAAYGVLQGLHDQGVLELIRGLLGSGDRVTELAVEAAKAPPAVRALRNLLIILRTLGEIDPDLFDGFALALPEALARAKKEGMHPPGLWATLNKFRSEDLRRGLVAVNSLLEAWGRDFFREARGGAAK
jgi:uncharacterized protein YjgD (DUF1641 family)